MLKEIMTNNFDTLKENKEEFLDLFDDLLCNIYKEKSSEIDSFMIKVSGIVNKGHFCKHTARLAIEKMKPTLLLHDSNAFYGSMLEYLETVSLDEKTCSEMVYKAYRTAKEKGMEYNYEAPQLEELNEYDVYTAFAMVLADYWATVYGDFEKAAMLTYQWLSDPDADGTKTWKYLMET